MESLASLHKQHQRLSKELESAHAKHESLVQDLRECQKIALVESEKIVNLKQKEQQQEKTKSDLIEINRKLSDTIKDRLQSRSDNLNLTSSIAEVVEQASNLTISGIHIELARIQNSVKRVSKLTGTSEEKLLLDGRIEKARAAFKTQMNIARNTMIDEKNKLEESITDLEKTEKELDALINGLNNNKNSQQETSKELCQKRKRSKD